MQYLLGALGREGISQLPSFLLLVIMDEEEGQQLSWIFHRSHFLP